MVPWLSFSHCSLHVWGQKRCGDNRAATIAVGLPEGRRAQESPEQQEGPIYWHFSRLKESRLVGGKGNRRRVSREPSRTRKCQVCHVWLQLQDYFRRLRSPYSYQNIISRMGRARQDISHLGQQCVL